MYGKKTLTPRTAASQSTTSILSAAASPTPPRGATLPSTQDSSGSMEREEWRNLFRQTIQPSYVPQILGETSSGSAKLVGCPPTTAHELICQMNHMPPASLAQAIENLPVLLEPMNRAELQSTGHEIIYQIVMSLKQQAVKLGKPCPDPNWVITKIYLTLAYRNSEIDKLSARETHWHFGKMSASEMCYIAIPFLLALLWDANKGNFSRRVDGLEFAASIVRQKNKLQRPAPEKPLPAKKIDSALPQESSSTKTVSTEGDGGGVVMLNLPDDSRASKEQIIRLIKEIEEAEEGTAEKTEAPAPYDAPSAPSTETASAAVKATSTTGASKKRDKKKKEPRYGYDEKQTTLRRNIKEFLDHASQESEHAFMVAVKYVMNHTYASIFLDLADSALRKHIEGSAVEGSPSSTLPPAPQPARIEPPLPPAITAEKPAVAAAAAISPKEAYEGQVQQSNSSSVVQGALGTAEPLVAGEQTRRKDRKKQRSTAISPPSSHPEPLAAAAASSTSAHDANKFKVINVLLGENPAYVSDITKYAQEITNNPIAQNWIALDSLLKGNSREAVKWFRKAALQGLAEAQFNLGTSLYDGDGVAMDKVEAVKWLRRAAEKGHAEAQFNLGQSLYDGDGVATDKIEAVEWYRKASLQGLSAAQFNLGTSLYNGDGITMNKVKAVKWFRRAAEQGHAAAQSNLGVCLFVGDVIATNNAEAVKWWRLAAEQGQAAAQFNLGQSLYDGDGVMTDKTEAVEWYRKAALQGFAEAQFNLGTSLYDGDGVAMDKVEAVKWLRRAAEKGHAEAQCIFGSCLYNGDGVAMDKAEAAKWYRLAAEQGFAVAQCNLGSCLYNGDDVTIDTAEAVKWYRMAAEQGFAEALSELEQLAAEGDRDALFNMGMLCLKNSKQSQGMEYMQKAAQQGHPIATRIMEQQCRDSSKPRGVPSQQSQDAAAEPIMPPPPVAMPASSLLSSQSPGITLFQPATPPTGKATTTSAPTTVPAPAPK